MRHFPYEFDLVRNVTCYHITLEIRGLTWGRDIAMVDDGQCVYHRYLNYFQPFGACRFETRLDLNQAWSEIGTA
jgi:hypothetical protein